jgi:ParB family chromosome partitioning protein
VARLKEHEGCVGRGGDSFIFDPEMIEEKPGYNVRNMDSAETQEHIRKMADAIKIGGTSAFPPITIHQEDGKVYVVAGYCRRRAFILAKQEGAPIKGILAVANTQTEAERALDLLNSNDGLPLTPLEKATAVKRLVSFQWTPQEIAERRGVSVTAIQNLLSLLEAPAEAIALVETGKVSATLAVETVRKDGAICGTEKLKEAVKTAEKQGRSHATAKHLPKREMGGVIEQDNPAIRGEHPIDTARKGLTDWQVWGPRCHKYLEKIRDAGSIAELQQMQVDLRHFLAGMGKG